MTDNRKFPPVDSSKDAQSDRVSPDEKAAVELQAMIRAYQVQKKYVITPLSEKDMTAYRAFLIGNDPVIPDLNKLAPTSGGVALVGTSGFRSLLLAAQLGEGDKSRIPRIFIVDNSREVHALWQALKTIANTSNQPSEFMEQLGHFLNREQTSFTNLKDAKFQCQCKDCGERENQDPMAFFDHLISQYGFPYVRSMIQSTVLVQQSFADKDTFTKIKNLIDYQEIKNTYVYPSNIVCHIHWQQTKYRPANNLILENIEMLNPKASIHTDICRKHWEPKKAIVLTDQTPNKVREQLGVVLRTPTRSNEPTEESLSESKVGLFQQPNSEKSQEPKRETGALRLEEEENNESNVTSPNPLDRSGFD